MEEATETPAGEPEATAAPAPPRPRRWLAPTLVTPAVLLVVLIIAWAVDSSSGGVARNVEVGGRDVGGRSESELAAVLADLGDDLAGVPVELRVDDDTYRSTAGELGLVLDEDRTAERVLDVDRDTFAPFRPFAWAASLVGDRSVALSYQVNAAKLGPALLTLEGDDRVPATEPTVELVDGTFRVVPGVEGSGLDPTAVAESLADAAAGVALGEEIVVDVDRVALPPLAGPEQAEQAAAGAEALVSSPLTVTTSAGDRKIEPDALRQWVTLTTNPDGSVVVDFDQAKVAASLEQAFRDIAGGPKDARFTVEGGTPVIVPEQPGKVCCGPDSAARLIDNVRQGNRTVALDLVDGGTADFTAADAAKLGIVQEIGSPTAFGPTTEHKCCEGRVTNIHRIADLVRGVVIRPGETFSINEHVGPRTRAKGFVEGGAISGGVFVTGIGGGISQFATTLFNAALFAGLDFGEYQSHSLYITRYPKGREATLSFPHPDLEIKNTTPYGVLIWPTYTDTSLTVHLYSTPYATVSVGEATPSAAGNCTKWTTPRTRTFPDGSKKSDSVFARYRPAEGVNC